PTRAGAVAFFNPARPRQKGIPVLEFEVGDRVRIRALPAIRIHAGKTGKVVAVEPVPASARHFYAVRLDDGRAGDVPFWGDELEPEKPGPSCAPHRCDRTGHLSCGQPSRSGAAAKTRAAFLQVG